MKHFSWTGDPAITCFSFSPSTETDGTETIYDTLVQLYGDISDQEFFAWRLPTYDVKLENLADFGVCWHLAVKVARVRRIGEFQLQRILPASGGRRGSIRTISNSSIDPITSINHNLYLFQSWSTSSNPINGISQEFHSNTQWLVTYTFQELQMRHEITIYVNDNTNVIANANVTMQCLIGEKSLLSCPPWGVIKIFEQVTVTFLKPIQIFGRWYISHCR